MGSDPEVFEHFYRAHVDAIQSFLARRLPDPFQVADLTADVFLAAIESATTYDAARGTPIAWLYGIARQLAASELRRGERERRAAERLAGRRLLDQEDYVRLEQRIDAAGQSRDLYQAMQQLSDGERAVVELVALDGLTVAQAARSLGIAGVTARVRLFRARRYLRDQLGEPGGDHASQFALVLEVEP